VGGTVVNATAACCRIVQTRLVVGWRLLVLRAGSVEASRLTLTERANGDDGATGFFLCAADSEQRWVLTGDVNSLVRDKGIRSQKILRYLRRRSCSSSTLRLDLVMLIIDR
jgi:hypothetical protein